VWSAEKRAEGLEYMHPKPSSPSGRIVDKPETDSRLVANFRVARDSGAIQRCVAKAVVKGSLRRVADYTAKRSRSMTSQFPPSLK